MIATVRWVKGFITVCLAVQWMPATARSPRSGDGGQRPGLIRLRSRMSPGRSTPARDYDAVATTVPTPGTEPVPLGALVMCSTTTWTTVPVIVEPGCVTLLVTMTPR